MYVPISLRDVANAITYFKQGLKPSIGGCCQLESVGCCRPTTRCRSRRAAGSVGEGSRRDEAFRGDVSAEGLLTAPGLLLLFAMEIG